MSMTTDRPHTDDLDKPGSYWHSKRTIAAGMVLVLVAVGIAWALTTGGDDKRATGSVPAAYESACGLTGGDTTEPTRGPEVQWQNIDGNWLPISTTHGPGKRETGGAWSCFAHTPTGAVLAAQTIPGIMNVADDYASVVREQTVPGADQLAGIKRGQPRFTGGQTATPLGFVLNSYTDDGSTATVTFYVRASSATRSPTTVRYTSTVHWFGGRTGDWLLRLTSDGGSISSIEPVSGDLAGIPRFVEWGPNS